MSIFARFMGGTAQPSAPEEHASASQARPLSDEAKQRELTVELTRLLARKPQAQSPGTRPAIEFEDDESRLAVETLAAHWSSGFSKTARQDHDHEQCIQQVAPSPAASVLPPSLPDDRQRPAFGTEDETPPAPASAQQARWVATSKRARFNSGVRKAASWMISVFAGVFIFAVVALIVLGPPKSYNDIIDWPSKSFALTTADVVPARKTRTASDLATRNVKIQKFRLSEDKTAAGDLDQGR